MNERHNIEGQDIFVGIGVRHGRDPQMAFRTGCPSKRGFGLCPATGQIGLTVARSPKIDCKFEYYRHSPSIISTPTTHWDRPNMFLFRPQVAKKQPPPA